MSALRPFGTFPTPYGVPVNVYKPDPINPADPEAVLFSMDATAICAGIHDDTERRRFVADAKRLGRPPRFEDYGGHTLPKVRLPRPRQAAYPRVAGLEADVPVEAWTTGVLERHRWCDRAEFLIDIIGHNYTVAAPWRDHDIMAEVYPLGLSITLTAALEHLCETEIDCIEAAAFYALTEHEEWREAAISWLRPFRQTWFQDWRNARPRYVTFAKGLSAAFDIPLWIFEGGAQ